MLLVFQPLFALAKYQYMQTVKEHCKQLQAIIEQVLDHFMCNGRATLYCFLLLRKSV